MEFAINLRYIAYPLILVTVNSGGHMEVYPDECGAYRVY